MLCAVVFASLAAHSAPPRLEGARSHAVSLCVFDCCIYLSLFCFAGGEDDEDLEGLARELPPGSGGAGGKAAAAGSGSGSDAADTSLVRGSDGEGEIDTSGVMGGMEGLRIGGGPAAGGGGGGIGSALGKR